LRALAESERQLLTSRTNDYFASKLRDAPAEVDGQFLHPKLQYLMQADSSTARFEALEKKPENWETSEGLRLIRNGVDVDWTARAIDVSEHVRVDEHVVVSPQGRAIPVIVTSPHRASRCSLPLVLYFHGGGFLIGSARALQPHAELLSHLCEAVVVNVDYRLAPEAKFPAAFEDAFAVYDWCAANGSRWGADPSRIAASGDSAGGCLSLNIAMRQIERGSDPLTALLLYYPMADTSTEYDSFRLFGDGFGLDQAFADTFVRLVYRTPEDEKHPYLRPVTWSGLGGLPPTIIATAGFDIIRDQGVRLAQEMKKAGAEVHYRNYASLNHSFIKNAGVVDDAQDACFSTAAMLKLILDRGERPA
ncbi:MAG: alpha/beta hydrolase, partial [Caulobacterales bacterium]|nr:alpha/beta hydrolase [Caulobacterales bacterium]